MVNNINCHSSSPTDHMDVISGGSDALSPFEGVLSDVPI